MINFLGLGQIKKRVIMYCLTQYFTRIVTQFSKFLST